MPELHPILLCGGSGTRLWPLSRKSFPKQFVPLTGETTLFQAAAARMAGAPGVAAPVVVTNSDFRFIVTEQLAHAGIDPGAVLIEPSPRNTAPAMLAAALHLLASDPEALMLVMPTDHEIPDRDAFRAAVAAGVVRARGRQFGGRRRRTPRGHGGRARGPGTGAGRWHRQAAIPMTAGAVPVAIAVQMVIPLSNSGLNLVQTFRETL